MSSKRTAAFHQANSSPLLTPTPNPNPNPFDKPLPMIPKWWRVRLSEEEDDHLPSRNYYTRTPPVPVSVQIHASPTPNQSTTSTPSPSPASSSGSSGGILRDTYARPVNGQGRVSRTIRLHSSGWTRPVWQSPDCSVDTLMDINSMKHNLWAWQLCETQERHLSSGKRVKSLGPISWYV